MNMFTLGSIVIFGLTIGGCASHNIPDTQTPNVVLSGILQAVVDQNGTFYPDEWEDTYGSPNIRGAYSLRTLAKNKNKTKALLASEEIIIKKIGEYLSEKNRVFILVHGYNNGIKLSRNNYKKIRDKLALKKSDGVVEFYWDGLISKTSIFGDAKIWFNATGYSQLGGAEGLRDILNTVHKKDIYIITHSRGASVALSALSNPPYGSKFAKDTFDFHGIDVNSIPISNNGNIIKLLLLAPAVDLVDFKKPDYDKEDHGFRDLGEQLSSILYTVNPNDPILKKFIEKANLDDNFNPTGLGYRAEIGKTLNEKYKIMKGYPLKPNMHSHDFSDYIEHESFRAMLVDSGIYR